MIFISSNYPIGTIRILQWNMRIFYERSYVKINGWLLSILEVYIYIYMYICRKVAYSMWFVRNEISKSRNTWVDVDSPTIFLFWKNVRKRYDCIIISIRCSSICTREKRTQNKRHFLELKNQTLFVVPYEWNIMH